MSFWNQLPRPVFALAPMEDVSDTVFRELVARFSSPEKLHLLFTEFMSVDGFLHEKGHLAVAGRLLVSEQEQQVLDQKGIRLVAQIWGTDPEKFYRAAKKIAEDYRFEGIDINMGCPVKKIIRNGGCSNLIGTPELAKEIVLATMEGSGLPVSVKTRTGIREVVTEQWIGTLMETRPAAITLHGRTQKMQSEGEADWDQVRKAVEVRDEFYRDEPVAVNRTLILGNGDVWSHGQGLELARETEADGIMVGRGIFKNPAFFAENEEPDVPRRMEMLEFHLRRFREMWEGKKNYNILKRFFKIYVNSFEDASELRARLMDTTTFDQGMEVARSVSEVSK